jgi:hypothetical protein
LRLLALLFNLSLLDWGVEIAALELFLCQFDVVQVHRLHRLLLEVEVAVFGYFEL